MQYRREDRNEKNSRHFDTSNNQVRIGDANISYAGIEVDWSITSDQRAESHIMDSNLGLDFVSMLRPVSYARRNDENQRTEYGFIAQEIEKVLKQERIKDPGMITVDDHGMYHLRYNDLLAPMVKAIQELKQENDKKNQTIVELNKRLANLETLMARNKPSDVVMGR
jgi:trimeric autotransporter adhesin